MGEFLGPDVLTDRANDYVELLTACADSLPWIMGGDRQYAVLNARPRAIALEQAAKQLLGAESVHVIDSVDEISGKDRTSCTLLVTGIMEKDALALKQHMAGIMRGEVQSPIDAILIMTRGNPELPPLRADGYLRRQLELFYSPHHQPVAGWNINLLPPAYVQDSWRAYQLLFDQSGNAAGFVMPITRKSALDFFEERFCG